MFTDTHYELLGLKVKDAVTGFTGIVTTMSFDLYGCIQAIVTPLMDKNGECKEGKWYDVTRLVAESNKPVMERPNFAAGYISEGKKGCAEKPLPGA